MLDLGEFMSLDADNLRSSVYLKPVQTPIFFRCNRLNGCISRNRIFTHSLTHSVRPSKLISRIQAWQDRKEKIFRIRDKGYRIRD